MHEKCKAERKFCFGFFRAEAKFSQPGGPGGRYEAPGCTLSQDYVYARVSENRVFDLISRLQQAAAILAVSISAQYWTPIGGQDPG